MEMKRCCLKHPYLSVKTQNAQQPEPGRNARALSDFLARHERISKNAEKNK